MSGTVVDINTRREPEPSVNRVCTECGSEWWNLAVVVDQAGNVTGRAGWMECRNCGQEEWV